MRTEATDALLHQWLLDILEHVMVGALQDQQLFLCLALSKAALPYTRNFG